MPSSCRDSVLGFILLNKFLGSVGVFRRHEDGGRGIGRHGVRNQRRHHRKYADLVDAGALRPGVVHLLHGVPRGTGAPQTGSAIPHPLLPDDRGGRRPGRHFRGFGGPAHLREFLRVAAGIGALPGARPVRLEPRSGDRPVVPRLAGNPAVCGSRRHGADGGLYGEKYPRAGGRFAGHGAQLLWSAAGAGQRTRKRPGHDPHAYQRDHQSR